MSGRQEVRSHIPRTVSGGLGGPEEAQAWRDEGETWQDPPRLLGISCGPEGPVVAHTPCGS